MTSTPLPEQGGFNERLTEILATAIEKNVRDGMRYGAKQEREKIAIFPFSIDEPVGELRAAIRTLVLEEIIGENELSYSIPQGMPESVYNRFKGADGLRAEQRKKLETLMAQSNQKCGHTGQDWNGEGDCITCARDKVLGMAQSNGDERLRDKVDTILNHFEVTVPDVGDVGLFDLVHPRVEDKYGNGVEWGIVMSEELMQLILADRKQHELDARIDELEHVLDGSSNTTWKREWYSVEERIDELNAERERLGN